MEKGDVHVAFQDLSLFQVQNGNSDFGPILKLHMIWPMNRHCCYPLYMQKNNGVRGNVQNQLPRSTDAVKSSLEGLLPQNKISKTASI